MPRGPEKQYCVASMAQSENCDRFKIKEERAVLRRSYLAFALYIRCYVQLRDKDFVRVVELLDFEVLLLLVLLLLESHGGEFLVDFLLLLHQALVARGERAVPAFGVVTF